MRDICFILLYNNDSSIQNIFYFIVQYELCLPLKTGSLLPFLIYFILTQRRLEFFQMWAYESVFYQIYPLGFCGAPKQNDGILTPRIQKVQDWIPHILDCGANAIYFSPIFESDAHGYDPRDSRKIDCRLGI